MENNLITKHIKQMLGKNFDTLIDENRLTYVRLMYDLFLRIGPSGIHDLREAFANYIKVKRKHLNLKFCEEILCFIEDSWS